MLLKLLLFENFQGFYLMANYVEGNIVSQSYVHVDPKWLSNVSSAEREQRINKIKKDITDFAESRIPFFIGKDVNIEVEFIEGSIIAKITSYGKMTPLLIACTSPAIINYPEYRAGVKEILRDVQALGQYINSEVLFQTNTKLKSERKSVEARLGVFGTADRINGKINELIEYTSGNNRSVSITYTKVLELHSDILTSLDKIDKDAIDDSDSKLAASMWIDGIDRINMGKLQFKIQDKADEVTYNLMISEKGALLKNLNDRL